MKAEIKRQLDESIMSDKNVITDIEEQLKNFKIAMMG